MLWIVKRRVGRRSRWWAKVVARMVWRRCTSIFSLMLLGGRGSMTWTRMLNKGVLMVVAAEEEKLWMVSSSARRVLGAVEAALGVEELGVGWLGGVGGLGFLVLGLLEFGDERDDFGFLGEVLVVEGAMRCLVSRVTRMKGSMEVELGLLVGLVGVIGTG
jgi:hypothetical protein